MVIIYDLMKKMVVNRYLRKAWGYCSQKCYKNNQGEDIGLKFLYFFHFSHTFLTYLSSFFFFKLSYYIFLSLSTHSFIFILFPLTLLSVFFLFLQNLTLSFFNHCRFLYNFMLFNILSIFLYNFSLFLPLLYIVLL